MEIWRLLKLSMDGATRPKITEEEEEEEDDDDDDDDNDDKDYIDKSKAIRWLLTRIV